MKIDMNKLGAALEQKSRDVGPRPCQSHGPALDPPSPRRVYSANSTCGVAWSVHCELALTGLIKESR
jgi:hypothetical protein